MRPVPVIDPVLPPELRVQRAGERFLLAEDGEQRLQNCEVFDVHEQRARVRERCAHANLASRADLIRGIELQCDLFDDGEVVFDLHFRREPFGPTEKFEELRVRFVARSRDDLR